MSTTTAQTIEDIARNYVMRTCPHCFKEYILGVDGITNGCDQCEGIVRNPLDGSIINDNFTAEIFIREVKE